MEPTITLKHVQANGLALHCAVSGEAGRPLVVLLHGFPEHALAWEQQLLDLGRDHLVVAPDLRGYNLSDKPPAVRDYRAHLAAADVIALAEAFGSPRFGLVGHDWGAAVAYAAAIARPERVRRLVIANGVHPAVFARELRDNPAQAAASSYMNFFRRPDAAAYLLEDNCARLVAMLGSGGFGDAEPTWFDPATRAGYIAAWKQPGALEGALNYYRASPLHPPTEHEPGVAALTLDDDALMVHVPTLVLWGERDRALLPGCAVGIERWVPDVRTVRFPNASHWIAHEEPEAVSRHIREHMHG